MMRFRYTLEQDGSIYIIPRKLVPTVLMILPVLIIGVLLLLLSDQNIGTILIFGTLGSIICVSLTGWIFLTRSYYFDTKTEAVYRENIFGRKKLLRFEEIEGIFFVYTNIAATKYEFQILPVSDPRGKGYTVGEMDDYFEDIILPKLRSFVEKSSSQKIQIQNGIKFFEYSGGKFVSSRFGHIRYVSSLIGIGLACYGIYEYFEIIHHDTLNWAGIGIILLLCAQGILTYFRKISIDREAKVLEICPFISGKTSIALKDIRNIHVQNLSTRGIYLGSDISVDYYSEDRKQIFSHYLLSVYSTKLANTIIKEMQSLLKEYTIDVSVSLGKT